MNSATAMEAAKAMANIDTIKDVTVTYLNGDVVSGFVQQFSLGTTSAMVPTVVLCKHSVARSENPKVQIDFTSATMIEITRTDGSQTCFS